MSFEEFRECVRAELYRAAGRADWRTLLRYLLLKGDAYRYVFWMRACALTRHHPCLKWFAYPVCRVQLHRLVFRLGISIPHDTRIGRGFYIGHFGGIVVNRDAVIGRNCNISHGVTIGQANRGRNKGTPVIGDNVYIGPGAKIVGAVRVGDNAAIGANSVVTRDVPDHGVVAGVPAQLISRQGSQGYVHRTDYETALAGRARTARLPRGAEAQRRST